MRFYCQVEWVPIPTAISVDVALRLSEQVLHKVLSFVLDSYQEWCRVILIKLVYINEFSIELIQILEQVQVPMNSHLMDETSSLSLEVNVLEVTHIGYLVKE